MVGRFVVGPASAVCGRSGGIVTVLGDHRHIWPDLVKPGKAPSSEGIDREPSVCILRLINELLPVFSELGSLPV